jgi:hypothetical protein
MGGAVVKNIAVGPMNDNFDTYEVKDRLVVFQLKGNGQEFIENLGPTADKLVEAGATAVIVLTDGITLDTLDEQQLTEIGLKRDTQ